MQRQGFGFTLITAERDEVLVRDDGLSGSLGAKALQQRKMLSCIVCLLAVVYSQ
jgi:hypothetical protein